MHVHGVSGSLSSPSSSPVLLVVAMLAGGLGEAARASSAMGARVDACAGAAWVSLFRVIKPCRLSRCCAFCAGPLSNPPLLGCIFPSQRGLVYRAAGHRAERRACVPPLHTTNLTLARALDPLSDHPDAHAWPGMGGKCGRLEACL